MEENGDGFKLHPDGPWRLRAFLALTEHVQADTLIHIERVDEAQRESVKQAMIILTNKDLVRGGVQRFYRLKTFSEDKEKEHQGRTGETAGTGQ